MNKEQGRSPSARNGKPASVADMFAAALRHEAAGKPAEAETLYRQILAQDPRHAASVDRLGLMALQAGRDDLAISLLAAAVRLNPREAVFRFNLANALLHLHRAEEATRFYREALTLAPDLDAAHHNLGLALCMLGQLDAGFASIRHGSELRARTGADAGQPLMPYKTKHDREQIAYLIECGMVDAAEFGAWRQRSPRRFQQMFAAISHVAGGERLATPAVNPGTDAALLQQQWQDSAPKLVVIDDLLTPAALEELRRYCLGSTIWRRSYAGGYLGALAETGFAGPLIAQIAEELRDRYAAIIGQHTLTRWWAFKYDSELKGINLHADFAAVNVNFWITPDEANLDPEGSGLIVWDIAAPLDWNFSDYNMNESAARAFLDQSGAKPIRVPYRANRAVIFDSNLFHETDRIQFREGYANRRINITLLYGWRG
jgi:tetratricopeptide (TPR) repeat protein